MARISAEEMQQDVSACLERVEAGETLIILRGGKPVAEVKSVRPQLETDRPFGLCAGEFEVPEDFDAPLPEDIIEAFEGE